MLVETRFLAGAYSQPDFVKPLTVNVTDGVDFLESDELVTVHVPSLPVVQVVAPVPADQLPATDPPAIGRGQTKEIRTVAVQPLRPAGAVVAVRPPTHICWAAGGEVTVTAEVVVPVAPSLSVTFSATL